jgi:Ca-activated chloride channel family protein
MPAPQIEVIPIRQGVRNDAATDLAVLIRVVPPAPEVHVLRPPINLGLVLDRSGSMAGGRKMHHAREAAAFAVEQLLPDDRVSVTIFDEHVETIVPSSSAVDKLGIVARLSSVEPRGSTALYDGWAAGMRQVESGGIGEGLNRVLLLSDGLANVGLSDPMAIAGHVRAARQRGVTTTTLGVGDDYNEDLMEAMAKAGDGNYYFVETSRQLADLFQTELQGLMATVGEGVVLALEPRNGAAVAQVLNDLERTDGGHLRLANLVVGMPLEIVVRLTVPAVSVVTELLRVRLNWTEPGRSETSTTAGVLILPAVSSSIWDELPQDAVVAERLALLEIQQEKLRAVRAAEAGDLATTQAILTDTRARLGVMYATAERLAETQEIDNLQADLNDAAYARMVKRAKWGNYRRSRNRPSAPPPSGQGPGGPK